MFRTVFKKPKWTTCKIVVEIAKFHSNANEEGEKERRMGSRPIPSKIMAARYIVLVDFFSHGERGRGTRNSPDSLSLSSRALRVTRK